MSALSLALGLAGGLLAFRLLAFVTGLLWGFFRLEMHNRREEAWRKRHGWRCS